MYGNLVTIAQEEIAHANLITGVVGAIGGVPYPKCTYNFSGVHDVISYLRIGQFFEATGTAAYDGGLNGLTDPNLQSATATIATVEARHSSYLNSILGVTPFPVSAFDPTLLPAQVVAAIMPYIVSCPFGTPVLPTVRPYGVALNSPSGTAYTGPLANSSNQAYNSSEALNDLAVLNYALVLEQLESFFYNTAQTNFSMQDFINANYTATTYGYFNLIALNERTHVSALRGVITSRGGTPVPNCTYSFPVTTVADYIRVAALLENTGVSAYDGAANGLTDTNLQQIAATIATVEARHAALLNALYGQSPFPSVNDTALPPAQIVAAASAFQNCPFTPTLPTVAPLQVPQPQVLPVTPVASSTGPASARSDPRFVGFWGQSFFVTGSVGGVYNLLSDAAVQMNAYIVYLQSVSCPVIDGKAMVGCFDEKGTYFGVLAIQVQGGDYIRITGGPSASGFHSVSVGDVRQLQVGEKYESHRRHQASASHVALSVHRSTSHQLLVKAGEYMFTIDSVDLYVDVTEMDTANWDALVNTARPDGLLGRTWNASLQLDDSEQHAEEFRLQGDDILGCSHQHDRFCQAQTVKAAPL